MKDDFTSLSFGRMVPEYDLSYQPGLDGFTIRFEEQVGSPDGALLVQVLRSGTPIWLAEIKEDRDGRWSVDEPFAVIAELSECAAALAEIDDGDRIFWDF